MDVIGGRIAARKEYDMDSMDLRFRPLVPNHDERLAKALDALRWLTETTEASLVSAEAARWHRKDVEYALTRAHMVLDGIA